jgi:hypothetical protein
MSEQTAPLVLKKYQWPCWWGGAAMSDTPPEIHEKLLAIRKSVGGLKARKEAAGPNFAVRKATDLMAKLRTALDATKCHAMVVKQDVTTLDPGTIPPDAKGRVLRSAVVTKTTIRVCAPDGSFVEAVGSGGGGDADDKAGGKASTYSYKDAFIKLLTLPDADVVDTDDEAEVGTPPQPSALLTDLMSRVTAGEDQEAIRKAAKDLPLFEKRILAAKMKEGK